MAKKARRVASTDERMRIEYIPLDVIAKWPRNPKLHADAELDESLERFGFVAPAIRDEQTKRLVAGHGRLERLLTWRDRGKPAPKRIEVAHDGAWLMPVVCGIAFANEQEAEAYLLADNQITMLRGWDGPKLQAIGDELINGAGLLGTGFDEESIRAEMERATSGSLGESGANGNGDGGSDEDVPEIPTDALVAKWQTALGQLWEIAGPSGIVHRVLCGDCRDPENVKQLHEGRRPRLGLHDPTYGIDIVAREGKGGIGDGRAAGTRSGMCVAKRGRFAPIEGDAGPFDPTHLLASANGLVLWGANNYANMLPPSAGVIVWDKREGLPEINFSDGELAWVSPSMLGRMRIIRHKWSGLDRASERGEKRLHPTQKPIEVQGQIVEWYSEPGDIVADWYMGAGAVLIACEKLGRVGHGMDIAPAYVAATLERMTVRGCKARLVS
jgi:hypothetical protein